MGDIATANFESWNFLTSCGGGGSGGQGEGGNLIPYDYRAVLYFCLFYIINIIFLKGHSQLVHMSIRYHFIANLHITEA